MSIGDHIRALKGGQWVHGIDCGDRTVIYFSAGGANGAPRGIRRTSWSDFAGGADQVSVVTHPERVFSPKIVVARAFSRLKEAAFSRMFPDSEQFAAWCKSGRLAEFYSLSLGAPTAAADSARTRTAKPKARRKAAPHRAKKPAPKRRGAPKRKAAPRPKARAGKKAARRKAAPARSKRRR